MGTKTILIFSLYIYQFSTVIDFSSKSTVDTGIPGTSREIYSEEPMMGLELTVNFSAGTKSSCVW